MNFVTGFTCIDCAFTQLPGVGRTICPECGGNLQVEYDYSALQEKITPVWLQSNPRRDHFRYAPFMPLNMNDDLTPKRVIPLSVGGTPLIEAAQISKELGIELYIKDEGKNPSGSLKDRASSVALLRAIEEGAQIITGASTGNAGSSMACLCASIGMPSVIFLPEAAPKAKVAQLLLFGANVMAVKGTYDHAFDLCLAVSAHFGWVNRNTGFNPYTREGKKTVSFEIIEQLNFEAPDYIAVSVGDGNIISGVHKGLVDFHKIGLLKKMPKIIAVQSTKSNAIAQGINHHNGVVKPVAATTVADSISVDLPRDGNAAVKAVLETKGIAIEVSDQLILDEIRNLAAGSGVFGEPAGVAAMAGVRQLVKDGRIEQGARVVTIVTGNGLKDVDSALKVAGLPHQIPPDLAETEKCLKKLGIV